MPDATTSITYSPSASAQIDQLPNELLSEIFVYTYNMLIIERGGPFDGLPICTFLSHVCQRWRNVAITCQYLWTLLPYRSREWTITCLARAHSAPVTLYLHPQDGDPRLREARRLVFPTIPRASSLMTALIPDRYDDAWRDAKEVLESLAAHTAPLLESLTIFIYKGFPRGVTYEPFPLVSLFKEETLPKLHHVNLDGCALRLTCSIFSPALTSLELKDSRIWSDMDEMVDFFRIVPLLESFIFTYPRNATTHGLNTEPSQIHPLRCVSLPNLRKFVVDASFEATIRMFSYLAFPPNAMLRLTFSDNNRRTATRYNEADLEGLITRGAAFVREHYAEYTKDGHYHESVEVDNDVITGPTFCLMIPCNVYAGNPRLHAAAAAMYLSIPVFSHATKLVIKGHMNGFTMRDLLCCKKVEHICLQGPAPIYLEAALGVGQVRVAGAA